jgi:hypothetical protein
MRVIFDKSAPYGLARYLEGHSVSKAEECGWGRLENGDLLAACELGGFEVLLTADKKPALPAESHRTKDRSRRTRSFAVAPGALTHP